MLKSTFHSLILSATYGMVLPISIPSPIDAQITVPTALAVGGGSGVPEYAGMSKPTKRLSKAVIYSDKNSDNWY